MKVKSIIKKVALALAGVAALTAVGFGIKAIVDYTQEDLKTISPTFQVGNLGSDGKFVDDESTLYTKEAFGCYGLQIKPDFDSTVNYQIFYYDILDNYISCTEFMSDGYSGVAPINGAYARIVIEPREDEDGKISLTERVKYPGQLTFKVNKNQDVNNRFVVFKGKVMQVVSDKDNLVFTGKLHLNPDSLSWEELNFYCSTSTTVLNVVGGYSLNFNRNKLGEVSENTYCHLYQFKDLPSEENLIFVDGKANLSIAGPSDWVTLDKKTKYVIISVGNTVAHVWKPEELLIMPSCFSIKK